jgi:large subunit ribosomal protein L25
MALLELNAALRTDTGKGAAHRLRAVNRIPGIVYGPGEDNVMVALDTRDFDKMIRQAAGSSIVINLKVAGEGKAQDLHCLIKEMQRDPVTSRPIHIDLLHVSMNKPVTSSVPVKLNGVSYGVKTEGGFMDHVMRLIDITCLAKDIPDFVELDVTELKVGDSIYTRDVDIPGIEVAMADDRAIVAIHGKTVSKAEQALEDEAAALAAGEAAEAEAAAAEDEPKADA